MKISKYLFTLYVTSILTLTFSKVSNADWYMSTAEPALTVRDYSDVSAKKIGSIPVNGKINVIERTNKKEFISGRTGEWVKIEWDNSFGYVFDSFLVPVEQTANSNSANKTNSNKLSEETPKFKDYPVRSIYNGKPAKLKMDDEFAKMFKTRLTEALSDNPNFAGEYVSATWGCGTSCAMTSFVNKKTGRVLNEGFGGEFGPFIVDYKIDSRLLVAQDPILDKDQVETGKYAAFFYVLDNDKLELVKTIEIDKPDDINGDGLPE